MFPATHPSRPRASGRVISLLLLTAAVPIGTLPTVRGLFFRDAKRVGGCRHG